MVSRSFYLRLDSHSLARLVERAATCQTPSMIDTSGPERNMGKMAIKLLPRVALGVRTASARSRRSSASSVNTKSCPVAQSRNYPQGSRALLRHTEHSEGVNLTEKPGTEAGFKEGFATNGSSVEPGSPDQRDGAIWCGQAISTVKSRH